MHVFPTTWRWVDSGCAPALSPEYLFHSASTEADGSSEAGRCPKILLKKVLDMLPLAQCVLSQDCVHNIAGSIATVTFES